MARHRRRRRHYGDLVKIPGLSGVLDAFKSPVKPGALGVGLLAGMAGTVLVMYGVNQYTQKSGGVSMGLYKAVPFIGAVGAGLGLFMLRKKKNRQQANSLLLGSLIGGILPVGWSLVKNQFASLSFLNGLSATGMDGYVVQPALANYGGVIVDNAGPGSFQGVIVDNAAPAQLSAYADLDANADEVAEALAP
jgi:hypothetical protein